MAEKCFGVVWVCTQKGLDDLDHDLYLLKLDTSRDGFRRLSIPRLRPKPKQGDHGAAIWNETAKQWRFVPD